MIAMEPIIQDFESDLDRIINQLDFIDIVHQFTACLPGENDLNASGSFVREAIAVHEKAKHAQTSLTVASGTLILYTCGRFESMARTLFEDLCQRLVGRAGHYERLPKKMRENLPIFTAKVISEPRKYGHAENGVRSFVATLADNLAVNAPVQRVNHECLSLTESNMRAEVLGELFGRVGGKSLWPDVAAQAALKTYFEERDNGKVESSARRKLDELMDLRNKIAHPSGQIEWPSTEALRDYILFLRLLSRSMADVVGVYEVTLCASDPARGDTATMQQ
jgi:hypothetical protein